MFNFANCLKLWIKLTIPTKQTKMVVVKTSNEEHQWNFKSKGQKPWNYWNYLMFLLPSVLESQNIGYKDHIGENFKLVKKTYQMQTLNVDKQLGFVSMASIEAMQPIMGWFKLAPTLHTRVELRIGNDGKEPNKNYVSIY